CLGKNFLILSLGEVISKILTFAAFAFLARILGPGGFGTIEFALTLIFVMSQVVDFGSEKFGAVQVAQGDKIISNLTSHVIILRLFFAGTSYIILTSLVLILNKPAAVKQVILLYGLSLFLLPGLLNWVFQGLDKMQWVAIFSITRQFIFALFIFLFIRSPEQLWIVALIEVCSVFGTIVLNVIIYRLQIERFSFRFNFQFSKSILKQTLPIFLSQAMMALKLHLPTILVGVLMIDNKGVGWFRASHRIVFALNTFVMLYLFNLLPSIARYKGVNFNNLHRFMHHSMRVTSWITIFIGVIGMILSQPIINGIYGAMFSEAGKIFQIMVWLIAIFILSGHYRYILIGFGHQKLDFRSTAIGAIVSIILCFTLIPAYGIAGAAWSMLIAEFFTWSFAYYFVRKEINLIPALPHIIKPGLISIGLIISVQFLQAYGFWLQGVLAILAYFLTMILFQPTIFTDIRILAKGNQPANVAN
nr:flippase [Nitrosopumilaceae archaeon]NIX60190.1 oligosaccharide flippase family protein [Nitrosopumilaceae archaeon]